jgi:hypothetical protein
MRRLIFALDDACISAAETVGPSIITKCAQQQQKKKNHPKQLQELYNSKHMLGN